MLIIGSHVSFTKEKQLLGSVEEALEYGSNTFMFYTGAPQNTNRVSIDENLTKEAHKLVKEKNINDVIVHAPYIINLANNKESDAYQFSISFMKQELKRCQTLGIKKIVLHPGNHVGIGEEKGIENIIESLNMIIEPYDDITICIESMSGKGSECGYNFEQLKKIIDGIDKKDQIKVCLDTCHLNDAGYDLTKFDDILSDFDRIIGINKIGCLHINDSKNIKGSRKDRHENIGLGEIGFNTLINIIYNKRLENIPKILETPYVGESVSDKTYPPYKQEIDMIKEKKFNEHLLDDIIAYYKKTN